MKLLLTILLILINSALFSQNKVKLFEDYKLCTTGIKSQFGTIIHEAIFSHVKAINVQLKNSKIVYYEVHYDEFVGLLNEYGTVILPWKYDCIEVLPDSNYIVSLNGKYGIVDRNDSVLLDFKYDFLEMPGAYHYRNQYAFHQKGYYQLDNHDGHFYFTVNNKIGLLDSNFVERIPAQYESILKTGYLYSEQLGKFDYFYEVGNAGFIGALDSNGVEILPCSYVGIETFVTINEKEGEEFYFLLSDEQKQKNIKRRNGDFLFSEWFDRITIVHSLWQDNAYQGACSVIAKGDNTTEVYNFASKKYFRNLINAMPFESYVLYEDENGWGIIDDLGVIITEGNKGVPSISEAYLQGFPDLDDGNYSYDGDFSLRNLSAENNVVHISYPHKFKKYHYGSEIELSVKKLGLRGAFNFRTGARIPMKYWSIATKKDRGEIYYWAIPPYDSKNDSLISIDIYDYSMTMLRQIKVIPVNNSDYEYDENYSDFQHTQFIYSDLNDSDFPKLMIHRQNNLWGAYNMKGEIVVPFEYQRIHAEFTNPGNSGDPPVFYVIEKDNRAGLLSADLDPLLPIEYDKIYFQTSEKTIWATKNTIMTLFNYDLSVYFDSIEHLFYQPLLNFNGSTQTKDSRTVSTYYYRSNGKLYVKENRTITLMDSTQILFSSPIITLFDAIKITKKGEIVGELDKRYKPLKQHPGKYLIDQGRLKIVDDNWILQLEVPGVSSVEECGSSMLLSFIDLSTGVVDLIKKKLKFKLDFPSDIIPIHYSSGYQSDYYWISSLEKKTAGIPQKWSIVNADGIVLDSLFEYPTVQITDVTRKNGKYGLLDDFLNPLLAYEYDFISLIRGTYLLKKDGLWGTYKKEKKMINPPKFHSISIIELSNGIRFVQEPGRIGVVDANFNLIVPMTSVNSISDSNDLFQMLLGKDMSNARYFGAFETSELPSAYRQISNENILRNINSVFSESTILELPITKIGTCFSKNPLPNILLNTFTHAEVNSIFYKKNNYYSEERKTEQKAVQSKVIVITHQQTERINYRIDGEKIEKIQLPDLFLDPSNMEAVLTEILTSIYTENQAFGLQCPNIKGIIQEAHNNFIISSHGIKLCGKITPEGAVFIPKEKLLPYLLDQKMFD